MFEPERSEREAHQALKLAGLWQKGHDHAWDAEAVLAESVERHGGVRIAPELAGPLSTVMNTILWGEVVGWRIASRLANELEPLEAKLAATSQALDEARHVTVLHGWMRLAGFRPAPPGPKGLRILERIEGAPDLPRQLIALHLMLEPIALALFQFLRAQPPEPVLADVFGWVERDEARHIAFGTQFLPTVLRQRRPWQLAPVWPWQLRQTRAHLEAVAELAPALVALGADPRSLFRSGQKKAQEAARAVEEELGASGSPLTRLSKSVAELQVELLFPPDGQPADRLSRMRRGLRRAVEVARAA
jgi:hypothetical protein